MPVSAQTVDEGWRETGRPAATPLPPGIASVLSVLSSSAVVLDAEDRVLQASDAARSFGLVEGEQLMAGEVLALARQVRRDGEIREGEYEVTPGGGIGGVTSFAVRVAPLGGDVGCDGLVLVLAEDQSESRRVEEVRRDFVANVSHELKTPVGALALLAETVEDAADDPDAVRRFAGRMRQEAARLTNLVQDIITLSRIQAAEPVPDPTAVPLDAVIAEALDRCRMKANARGIALADVGDRGLGVHGDEDLLITAIRNLLENAVAYSPERTRVRGHHPPGRGPGGDQRGGPGDRHPRPGPAADLRTLLPGRSGPLARHRRHRARPRNRQARDGGARRDRDRPERGRRRLHLHHLTAVAEYRCQLRL